MGRGAGQSERTGLFYDRFVEATGILSSVLAMKPSEALAVHRDALRALIDRHTLKRPRVFGSVLTGTDTDDSDLDLLVDPVPSTTLLTIAGLQIDAKTLLGVPVSVLTPNGLPPRFRDQVLRAARDL